MDYQQEIFDLIKNETGQLNLLGFCPDFIRYTGDMESALLLSQLIYWCDRTKNPEKYIYKTYSEWEEEICLNEYKLRKATKKLKELGILNTKIKKANGFPTVHYKLDTVKFKESFLQYLKNRNCKNSSIDTVKFKESITETTLTETTTKNTNTYNSQKNYYKKPMKFTDYEQREYNFKELEKKLIYEEPEEEVGFEGIDYIIKEKGIP